MSTKTIAILFILGIVILSGGLFFLLNKPQQKRVPQAFKMTETTTPYNPTKIVSYDGKTFMPKFLALKKGDTLSIINTTNENVAISVTGKKAAPIVYIDPNNSKTYPNIQEDGEYSFKDITQDILKIQESSNSGVAK